MDRQVVDGILAVQEAVRLCPEYEALWAEQERCNAKLLEVLAQLTPEQRTAVEDYIGILTEIHLRTLIYSLE